MSIIINSYRYGNAPSSSFYDLAIAASPVYYFRHAEPSGSIMQNEVGSDGDYVLSGVGLGSPALYAGGPTSVRLPAVAQSGAGRKVGETAPDLNSITVMGIIKFDASMSGLKALICYDNGGSLRKWQFRTNGTSLEWVKIQGGVDTKSYAAGLVNGSTYLIAVTIDVSGNFKFHINGSSVYTSTIGTTNYGGSSEYIEIGRCDGGGGILANSFFSESLIYDRDLSDLEISNLADAAGL